MKFYNEDYERFYRPELGNNFLSEVWQVYISYLARKPKKKRKTNLEEWIAFVQAARDPHYDFMRDQFANQVSPLFQYEDGDYGSWVEQTQPLVDLLNRACVGMYKNVPTLQVAELFDDLFSRRRYDRGNLLWFRMCDLWLWPRCQHLTVPQKEIEQFYHDQLSGPAQITQHGEIQPYLL